MELLGCVLPFVDLSLLLGPAAGVSRFCGVSLSASVAGRRRLAGALASKSLRAGAVALALALELGCVLSRLPYEARAGARVLRPLRELLYEKTVR